VAEHPIQLTPEEMAQREIVRVAEKCFDCDGGEVGLTYDTEGREIGRDHAYTCIVCDGTGHFPSPYEVGDVLVYEYPVPLPVVRGLQAGYTTFRGHLTVTSVESEQQGETRVWKIGLKPQEGE